MMKEAENQKQTTLRIPQTLPLFSVSGGVLLPHTRLPLNIYEEAFSAMIDEALANGRYIGVIQPTTDSEDPAACPPLYKIGTVGRITSFSETEDGRYLITIEGLCRFKLINEIESSNGYRRANIDAQAFLDDFQTHESQDIDRARLTDALRNYFKTQGVSADWNIVQNAASDELVSSLAMLCPLEPSEKQALLEADTFRARVDLLITLLEMAAMGNEDGDMARH